ESPTKATLNVFGCAAAAAVRTIGIRAKVEQLLTSAAPSTSGTTTNRLTASPLVASLVLPRNLGKAPAPCRMGRPFRRRTAADAQGERPCAEGEGVRYRAVFFALLGLSVPGFTVMGPAAQHVAPADVIAHTSAVPNGRAAQADLPSYPECLRQPISA